MKQLKGLLAVVLLGFIVLSGCKKQDPYDPEKQLAADEQLIKDFLAANNIEATRHAQSGVYYQILEEGTGNVAYTANTDVMVKYEGRLLNGQVFDSNTTGVRLTLGRLIYGWQIGIPLIQKGGKIRLFVPSFYGYGPNPQRGIPANSVLDFDIELLEIYQ